MIRVLDARAGGLDAVLAAVQRSPADVGAAVQAAVDGIVADVRARGDAALVELTARLDGFAAPDAAALAITRDEVPTCSPTSARRTRRRGTTTRR